MSPPRSSSAPEGAPLPIFALGRGSLVASALLRALAVVNVAYLIWSVLGDALEGTQNAPSHLVALGLALFSGLPWLAALALRRAGRGTLAIEAERLVIDLGRTRFEIPIASVQALRGSTLPAPDHAITLVLRSGKRFERALISDDPRALASTLTQALPDARAEVPAAALAFAAELHARTGRPRWVAAIKWGAAPVAVAIIAFRLQQIIMFGGPFGQYRQAGLGPYLAGFFDVWLSVAGDLILYAAAVRIVLETAAILGTWLAPRAARPVRLGAEGLALIAFFVVVPGFLAARLLG